MRVVLIPVKSFRVAKLRLSASLEDNERQLLARELASTVVRAAKSTPVYVACDDGEVADWATSVGGFVLWTPGLGLSGAVSAGVRHLHGLGVDLVIVAHADLPLVTSFDDFGKDGIVTLAPDLRLDGTNVAAVPAASGFRFAYGPGSYDRHRTEAARLGLTCRTIQDSAFATDIDTPADLEFVRKLRAVNE